MNGKSRDVFQTIWRLFFETVEQITGKPFVLWRLNPLVGKCRGIVLDAETAQFQGLGDYLVTINDPSLSGLTTRDPIELAAQVARTCDFHFQK